MKYLLVTSTFLFFGLTAWAQPTIDPFASAAVAKNSAEVMLSDPNLKEEVDALITQDVPIITCEELVSLRSNNDEVVLLDARPSNEYEVSHIKGARHIGYEDFSIEDIWAIDREAEVVLYCSVGQRSEEIGKKLMNMGFSNVRNLYGSIIEWVNQGNEVVDSSGEPTRRVHVHERRRAKWLRNGKGIF